jgi:hypothetical protein
MVSLTPEIFAPYIWIAMISIVWWPLVAQMEAQQHERGSRTVS